MTTRRINPYADFKGLLRAIVAFDHDETATGCVQSIILEGGRVITGCTTQKQADLFLYRRDAKKNEMMVEPYLRRLLELGEGFITDVHNMLPIHWQISG